MVRREHERDAPLAGERQRGRRQRLAPDADVVDQRGAGLGGPQRRHEAAGEVADGPVLERVEGERAGRRRRSPGRSRAGGPAGPRRRIAGRRPGHERSCPAASRCGSRPSARRRRERRAARRRAELAGVDLGAANGRPAAGNRHEEPDRSDGSRPASSTAPG